MSFEKKKKPNYASDLLKEAGPYLNLGLQMIVPILMGAFAGWKIDTAYGTMPLWTLILSALGIVIGFYSFFKTIRDTEKKQGKK